MKRAGYELSCPVSLVYVYTARMGGGGGGGGTFRGHRHEIIRNGYFVLYH